jgi:TolB-like protein
MIGNRLVLAPAIAILAVAGLSLGCAGSRRLTHVTGAPLADHPRVAVLPLENLSGAPDAGDAMTRLLGAELAARGWCEVVDIGQVQGVLRGLRVRNTAVLSLDQLRALGDSLGVRFLLTGSVLEHTMTGTEEGRIPVSAVTLKLLETPGGRVVWAKALAVTGKDRETLFGYGRETDPVRLDAGLVDDMLRDLGRLATPSPTRGTGARP